MHTVFLHKTKAGSMPIVYHGLANNESERFELRSHDYNYKYLRVFFDVAVALCIERDETVEWIILFAHYIGDEYETHLLEFN